MKVKNFLSSLLSSVPLTRLRLFVQNHWTTVQSRSFRWVLILDQLICLSCFFKPTFSSGTTVPRSADPKILLQDVFSSYHLPDFKVLFEQVTWVCPETVVLILALADGYIDVHYYATNTVIVMQTFIQLGHMTKVHPPFLL